MKCRNRIELVLMLTPSRLSGKSSEKYTQTTLRRSSISMPTFGSSIQTQSRKKMKKAQILPDNTETPSSDPIQHSLNPSCSIINLIPIPGTPDGSNDVIPWHRLALPGRIRPRSHQPKSIFERVMILAKPIRHPLEFLLPGWDHWGPVPAERCHKPSRRP